MALYDERDTIIAGLKEQLRQCREELAEERARESGVEEGVAQLRAALSPLKEGLDRIFGILPTSSSIVPSKNSPAWDDWKRKLGGQAEKAIDALLLHGAMNQVQLRIHIGCANGSTPGIVSQLWKAGLINKNGGKISLKEL
jgi:hypothetical protein